MKDLSENGLIAVPRWELEWLAGYLEGLAWNSEKGVPQAALTDAAENINFMITKAEKNNE